MTFLRCRLAIAFLMTWALLTIPNCRADEGTPDSVRARADDLRCAAADSVPEPTVIFPAPALVLRADDLADMDHEEFGDWMMVMPGFYPLDRAGFGSAYRGMMLGLPPSSVLLNFRGRRLEDRLLGAPELGWIPPEALNRVNFQIMPLETSGARLDAVLRSLEPAPPSSRVAVRDGYYGLGAVDFDLVQKVTPAVILNGGGRVATYNGRLPHSQGYGLNLRSEITFQATSDMAGWCGVMQNRLNSQVAFATVSHNRERYEADVALQRKSLSANLYGIQQRETYGSNGADGWDELGLIWRGQHGREQLRGEISAQAAAARWKMKDLSWSSTSFGNARARLNWRLAKAFQAAGYLGLEISDDFAPERHLSAHVEFEVKDPLKVFAGWGQHQRVPSRFEGWADFDSGAHYFPYDPVLYQNPGLSVLGNRDLRNETYSSIFVGSKAQTRSLDAALAGFWRRTEDPISWRVEGGVLRSYNATSAESRGALGWLIMRPVARMEFGATGSFLPKKAEEQRLFPEAMAHAWAQYGHQLFDNQLELRLRVWEDYWGKRQGPIPGGWETLGEAHVLSARISAYLLGVHLFWEVNNILRRQYELFPGYLMMHKEEVWGVSWNFRN